VQAVQAPPSRLHAKVEPGSSEEKSKLAFGESVGSGWMESMDVSG
jgi:hypothetical protein